MATRHKVDNPRSQKQIWLLDIKEEDQNSNSSKAKNPVENCYEKSFKQIKSAL